MIPNTYDSFLRKIEITDTCWLWAGSVHDNGYGYFKYKGKMRSAHRLSYTFHVGPIQAPLQIDHLCRNKLCVNPFHLETVTAKENTKRNPNHISVKKIFKLVCINGHRLDLAENIGYLNKSKNKKRCKTCHRNRERIRSQKKRLVNNKL